MLLVLGRISTMLLLMVLLHTRSWSLFRDIIPSGFLS